MKSQLYSASMTQSRILFKSGLVQVHVSHLCEEKVKWRKCLKFEPPDDIRPARREERGWQMGHSPLPAGKEKC